MSTKLAGFVIPGDGADGARNYYRPYCGHYGYRYDDDEPRYYRSHRWDGYYDRPNYRGGWHHRWDDDKRLMNMADAKRAAVFAPVALPSHRPSLLINPGLLG